MSNRQDEAITITLNGKETTLGKGATIETFLSERSLQGKLVVVEVNGTIVPRSDFTSRAFLTGDVVEVVHFVGGG